MILFLGVCSWSISAAEIHTVREPRQVLDSVTGASMTVLNFWATWCVPCVAEMNDLRILSDRFKENVRFVGISLDDAIPGDRDKTVRKVEKFLEAKEITYSNLYWIGSPDPLLNHFNLTGEIPVTIVFDAEGRELYRHEGIIEGEQFSRELERRLTGSR